MAGKSIAFELRFLGTEKQIKNIQELKQAIAIAAKEQANFAQGSAEYKKLETAILDAKAQVNKFNQEQRASQKAFDSLKAAPGSYRQIQAEVSSLVERLKGMSVGVNTTQEAFDSMANRIKEGKIKLADFDRELGASNQLVGEYDRGIIKAFKDLGLVDQAKNAFASLEKTQTDLNSKVDKLKTEFKEAGQAGKRSYTEVENELRGVLLELDKVNKNVEESRKEFAAVGDEVRGAGERITGALQSIAAEIKGSIVDGLKTIGAAFLAAFAVEKVVEFGAEIVEIVDKFDALAGNTQKFTGLTGEALDTLVAKVSATSEVFDKDYNEVLKTANTVAKQFGISVAEAVTLINEGFLSGADSSGEFLSRLTEVSAGFDAVGLTASETIALINEDVKGGIFSSKGEQVIKKASVNLREQSKATSDALKAAFGKEFSDELLQGISSGEISVFQGIQKIATELDKLPEQSKEAANVVADVFGKAGREAGVEFVTSLKDINTSLESSKESTNDYVQEQITLLKVNEDLARAQAELSNALDASLDSVEILGLQTKAVLIGTLAEFIELLKGVPGFIEKYQVALGALGFAILSYNSALIASSALTLKDITIKGLQSAAAYSAAVATRVLNVAMKANPIGLVVTAVALLIAGFAALYQKSETVRAAISGLGKVASEIFTIIKESVGAFIEGFNEIRDGEFKKGFSKLGEAIVKSNPVGIALTQGKRLGGAFNEGLTEELAKGVQGGSSFIDRIPELYKLYKKKEREEKEKAKREAIQQAEEAAKLEAEKKAEAYRKAAAEEAKKTNALIVKLTIDLYKLQAQNIENEEARLLKLEQIRFDREKEELTKQAAETMINTKLTGKQKAEVQDVINALLQQQQIEHNKNMDNIRKKAQDDERKSQIDKLNKNIALIEESLKEESEINKEQLAEKLRTQQEFADIEYDNRKAAIEQEMLLVEQGLQPYFDANGQRIKAEDELSEALLKKRRELFDQLEDAEREHAKTTEELAKIEKEKRIQAATATLQLGLDISNGITDLVAQSLQNQLDKEEEGIAIRQEKIDMLTEKVANSSGAQQEIYQKQLDAEVAFLDKQNKKKEDLQKKAARNAKAAAIIQAIISTALAAIQAYTSLVGTPFVGPIIAPIAAGAAAAFGAVQVGLIAAQQAEKGAELNNEISNVSGGTVPKGAGEIKGRRHSGGGVKFLHRGRPVEAEGGEITTKSGRKRFIFTRGVTKDPVLRKLAYATHNSGGSKYADMFASMVNMAGGGNPFNSGRVFAGGGVLSSPMPVPNITASAGAGADVLELIREMNENTKAVNRRIDQVENNFSNVKIVVPVDSVTTIQNDEKTTRQAGLY